jgi:hypothetical protein
MAKAGQFGLDAITGSLPNGMRRKKRSASSPAPARPLRQFDAIFGEINAALLQRLQDTFDCSPIAGDRAPAGDMSAVNDFNPDRGSGVTYRPGGDLFRLSATTT